MNYYKELIKAFHPDLNKNNERFANVITKVAIKLYKENNIQALNNMYDRLVTKHTGVI